MRRVSIAQAKPIVVKLGLSRKPKVFTCGPGIAAGWLSAGAKGGDAYAIFSSSTAAALACLQAMGRQQGRRCVLLLLDGREYLRRLQSYTLCRAL
ncbi:hypothetical protein D9M68_802340 [compost metagenome]